MGHGSLASLAAATSLLACGPDASSTAAGVCDATDVAIDGPSTPLADSCVPLSLTPVTTLDGVGVPEAVIHHDGYLLVGDLEFGLHVVDISNPAQPAIVGELALGSASGVSVAGEHAYVEAGANDVVVVDLSSLPNLTEVARIDTPGQTDAVGCPSHLSRAAEIGEIG